MPDRDHPRGHITPAHKILAVLRDRMAGVVEPSGMLWRGFSQGTTHVGSESGHVNKPNGERGRVVWARRAHPRRKRKRPQAGPGGERLPNGGGPRATIS